MIPINRTTLEAIRGSIELAYKNQPLTETYRHAIRGSSSMLNAEMVKVISEKLRFDVTEYLLRNGYQPTDFFEIMSAEFDYGNEWGAALSIKAIKEESPLPIGHRILLMLLRNNKLLAAENARLISVMGTMRPVWLRKVIEFFYRKENIYE